MTDRDFRKKVLSPPRNLRKLSDYSCLSTVWGHLDDKTQVFSEPVGRTLDFFLPTFFFLTSPLLPVIFVKADHKRMLLAWLAQRDDEHDATWAGVSG
jgi:hypothetical protein